MNFTNHTNHTNHTIHTILHYNEHGTDTNAVLFLSIAVTLGAMLRFLFKRLPIPYTVMLIVCGLITGLATKKFTVISLFTGVAHMNPHLLLHVFLPVLIFESAFAMDVHTFKKTLSQTLVLAGPGLAFCTVLTAVLARYIFTYNWSWFESLCFGSVLSATDPVAVVALLKELGASKRLGITIEGESLLNDGFAIILFKIFFIFSLPGPGVSGVQMMIFVVKILFCGPLLGIGMARITLFILSHVYNDALIEITLTLTSTYITFYLGERFEISGVLAVLILGIEVNSQKANISPEVEVFLHRFWEMLEYLANTLIFIIVGIVIADSVNTGDVTGMDWMFLVTLYFGLQVIRLIAIGCLWPVLTKIGYSICWKSILVMTWGGLRGAVGLALALIVVEDPRVNKTLGSRFLFHSAGIVLMTLLINATSIKYLLQVLGMFDIPMARLHTMKTALTILRRERKRAINMLKSDKFLAESSWAMVDKNTKIQNPYRTKNQKNSANAKSHFINSLSQCPNCEQHVASMLRPKEIEELTEEVRQRIIKAEKISYWKQFELGMLDREAVRVLLHTADTVIDQPNRLIEMKDIQHHWKIPNIVSYSRKCLERLSKLQQKFESISVPVPNMKCCVPFFKVSNHFVFEYIMISVVLVNVATTLLETALFYISSIEHYTFIVANCVFCLIYIAEFIVKLIGQRQYYFYSVFNLLDFIVLIFSIIDTPIMITMFALPQSDQGDLVEHSLKNFSFIRVIRIVRIIRFGRVLRLTKLFIPLCIKVVEYYLNRKLKFGYDVGKGYIVGKEEMMKTLYSLTFTPELILRKFIRASEQARLDTTKQLGFLRKDQPGIAVSIKTTQATRSVLNKCADTIRELQSRGVIDEKEAKKLTEQIEAKKKNVQNAPYSIACSEPRTLLENLPWVCQQDPKGIDYLMNNAEFLNFKAGETIIKQGDPADGIHLIINGMAKIINDCNSTETDQMISENALRTLPNNNNHERQHFVIQETTNVDLSVMDESTTTHKLTTINEDKVKKCESCNSLLGNRDTSWSDFIGTGIVLGETSMLMGTEKNATVTCEIPVQTLFIPKNIVFESIKMYPKIGEMLWRIVGVRIASKLLLGLNEYEESTSQEVQMLCQEAYLLQNESGLLQVPERVKHLILFVGECADNSSEHVTFKAPGILPPGIKSFRKQTDNTRILVVPKETLKVTVKPGEDEESSEEEDEMMDRVIKLTTHLCPLLKRIFDKSDAISNGENYEDYQHSEEEKQRIVSYTNRFNKVRNSLTHTVNRVSKSRSTSNTVHANNTSIRHHTNVSGQLDGERVQTAKTPSLSGC